MNNEIDEYTKGQNDMLALIKEIYYTSSKKEFEDFLGADDLDDNHEIFARKIYEIRQEATNQEYCQRI